MIWDLITGLLPDVWGYVAAAGAALVAAIGLYAKVRRGGVKAERSRQAEAGLDATIKGNAAARKGKAEAAEKLKQGKTPEEIVRGNDDAWR